MKRLMTIGLSLVALAGTPVYAEGDVDKGAKVFRKCKACHAVGDGAKNKVGPMLNDVFGRAAGAVEGFKYSPALMEKGESGLVWDEANLDEFLTKPKKFVEGTKMTFPGLRKEKDRENILAYLKTFSPDAE